MILPLTVAVIDGVDNAVLRRRDVMTAGGDGRAMVSLGTMEEVMAMVRVESVPKARLLSSTWITVTAA